MLLTPRDLLLHALSEHFQLPSSLQEIILFSGMQKY